MRAALLCMALLAASPAWAINKCAIDGGRVVYQDTPCPDGRGSRLDVRANGPAPAQPASGAAPSTSPQDGPYGEKWNRSFAIKNFELPPLQRQLENEIRRCDAQQRELARRKLQANNNLAGAVWEQSISSEMQAAATACDTRQRDIRTRIDALQHELDALR